MKVLLVGGAGYVGGGLVDLLSSKHDVIVYDNLLYEDSYLKNIKFVFGDIRDNSKISKYFKWADAVVWMAALVGDGACSINPNVTIDINLNTVKNLKKKFNKKIIFFSTCSVYGAQDKLLDETSEVKPLSVYATTKLEAEKVLKNTDAIIFRLGTLFGKGDDFSRVRMDLVVNTLVAKAIYEKKISVFGGEQYRPLLHVKDVAIAVEKSIKSKKSGVYNLHYKNMIIHQIANEVKKNFKNLIIKKINMKIQDLRNYRVSSKKAIAELGFKPKFDLKFGIQEMKKLILEKRIKDINNARYTNQIYLKKFKSLE